jgi:hypothetical protein
MNACRVDFRRSISMPDTHTSEWAGVKGKKKGERLKGIELAG